MLFELLSSSYSQGKKKFVKGGIVESNRDLVELFQNKFVRRLDLEEKRERETKPTPDPAPEAPAAPDAVVAEAAVVKSAEPAKGAKKPKPPAKPKPPVDEEMDVTEQFPNAASSKLVVTKKGDFFNVTDPDGEDPKAALNEEPLLEEQVVDFVESYLNGV